MQYAPGMFGSPFQAAIEALLKPLEFAARDDFAHLERVRVLERSVLPIVEVCIDGNPVGQVHLASTAWRPYLLPIDLTQGSHELALAFTNDYNRDGEDRNVMLDKAVFYRD